LIWQIERWERKGAKEELEREKIAVEIGN